MIRVALWTLLALFIFLGPVAAQDPIPPYPHPLPKWYEAKRAELSKTRSIDASSTPLQDLLDWLQKSMGIPILLDAPGHTQEDLTVDLKVDTLETISALKLMTDLKRLKMVFTQDGLVITSQPDKHKVPESIRVHKLLQQARSRLGEAAPKKPILTTPKQAIEALGLSKKKISVDLVKAPMEDVIGFIQGATRVSVVVDQAAKTVMAEDDKPVTLKAKDILVGDLLRRVLEPKMTWDNKGGVLFITTKAMVKENTEWVLADYKAAAERWRKIQALREKALPSSMSGKAVHELPAALTTALGVPVHVDRKAWKTMPTLPAGKWVTLNGVEKALRKIGVGLHVEPGAVYILQLEK